MPRQSGLLRRKGRYYFNIRVPTELRPLYGKREFLRKALKTSEYYEAASEARFEAARAQAEFESKRRTIKTAPITTAPPSIVAQLSEREAHDIVLRFFIGLKKEASDWCEDNRYCSEEERESLLETLRIDECDYSGTSKHYEPNDASTDVATFLKREGIECREDSPAFRKLCSLFRMARVENLGRTIERIQGRTVRAKDPLFDNAFAH